MAPHLAYDRERGVMPGQHNDKPDTRDPIARIEARVEELTARREWTPEEIDALVSMIALWRGFKAMGFVLSSLKQIGIWIMAFTAFVVAFRAGLLDWLGITGK